MLVYRRYIGEVSSDGEVGVLHARVINSGIYPIANAEAAQPSSPNPTKSRRLDLLGRERVCADSPQQLQPEERESPIDMELNQIQ